MMTSNSPRVQDLGNLILPNIIKLFLYYSQKEGRIMIFHFIACQELLQDNVILSSPLISWAGLMIEPNWDKYVKAIFKL